MTEPTVTSPLGTFAADEWVATVHALVVQMARSGTLEGAPEELVGTLYNAMQDVGVTPDMTDADVEAALQRYIASRPVRDDLLLALAQQVRG